jgi:hypothetical protein
MVLHLDNYKVKTFITKKKKIPLTRASLELGKKNLNNKTTSFLLYTHSVGPKLTFMYEKSHFCGWNPGHQFCYWLIIYLYSCELLKSRGLAHSTTTFNLSRGLVINAIVHTCGKHPTVICITYENLSFLKRKYIEQYVLNISPISQLISLNLFWLKLQICLHNSIVKNKQIL